MRMLGILLAALMLLSAGPLDGTRNVQQIAEEALQLDLSSAEAISGSESHGGFRGEDTLYTEFRCDAGAMDALLRDREDWRPLPMGPDAREILLSCDDAEAASKLSQVTNGYWYCYDRYRDAAEPQDYPLILARSPVHYTFGVFDRETGILYYLEVDS